MRGHESAPRNAALISDPSCASTIGCSLTIWKEGSCPRERDVVMTFRVAWTLGYVLHRVSTMNVVGMHKRESFLWPSDARSDFGFACFERGSKVIGSSE